jgi:hypothetical protein
MQRIIELTSSSIRVIFRFFSGGQAFGTVRRLRIILEQMLGVLHFDIAELLPVHQ